jgi:hypothetical protein
MIQAAETADPSRSIPPSTLRRSLVDSNYSMLLLTLVW